MPDSCTETVVIAGLGNIGSPLAGLVARLGIRRLRLIDRDRVEEKNVRSQDYRPADVGRFKAEVLAERLREQLPDIDIEARAVDLEDLPLGDACAGLILGALDSRRARQVLISELAWPLGVPVIDGGVGEGLRGRAQVFVPRDGAACLECTWGEADYRQLSEEYPCVPGGSAEAPPTAAPAFLGAAVASVMAAEAARILAGEVPEHSHEIAFDLHHRRHLTSRLRHNPRCRFGHEVVRATQNIGARFESTTAGELLAAVLCHGKEGAVHIESRRGLGPHGLFAAGRLVSLAWLRDNASRPLGELGFLERDLLRVRTAGASVFLRLSQREKP